MKPTQNSPDPASLPANFAGKWRSDSSGCWIWTGAKSDKGYGRTRVPAGNGKYRFLRAHRVSYEALVGPIPEGLTIDHLCRVKACINPAHMEPVSNAVNIQRAADALLKESTEYPCGHPRTPENTRVKVRNGKETRLCRECIRAEKRAAYARQRERRLAGGLTGGTPPISTPM